jgi:hypothetical protein
MNLCPMFGTLPKILRIHCSGVREALMMMLNWSP